MQSTYIFYSLVDNFSHNQFLLIFPILYSLHSDLFLYENFLFTNDKNFDDKTIIIHQFIHSKSQVLIFSWKFYSYLSSL